MRIDQLLRALTMTLMALALPATMLADVPAVPELNPHAAGSALTILAGLGLVLKSRRRR